MSKIRVKFFPGNRIEREDAEKVFKKLREKWKDKVFFENIGSSENRSNSRIEVEKMCQDNSTDQSLTYKNPVEFEDVESGIYNLGGFDRRTGLGNKQEIVEEVIEELKEKASSGESVDSEKSVDDLIDEAGLDDPPEF